MRYSITAVFWFGWFGSHSLKQAPSDGWFFAFPGLAVNPPFTPVPFGNIAPPPSYGTYSKKILTQASKISLPPRPSTLPLHSIPSHSTPLKPQGGGDTSWGDALYAKLTAQLPDYKPAGWDGVWCKLCGSCQSLRPPASIPTYSNPIYCNLI